MVAFQIRRLFCLNFSRLIESQTPERVSLGSLRLEETAEIQASDCLARKKKIEFSFPTAPVL